MPESRKFIEICVFNGSDFYKVIKTFENYMKKFMKDNFHTNSLLNQLGQRSIGP